MPRSLVPSVLLIALVGCNVQPPIPPGAEVVVEPKLPEEEIVRWYIIQYNIKPSSLRFIKWGPHDLDGQLGNLELQLTGNEEDKDLHIVRVVYWCEFMDTWTRHDERFALKDNKVKWWMGENEYGDDWLEADKQRITADPGNHSIGRNPTALYREPITWRAK